MDKKNIIFLDMDGVLVTCPGNKLRQFSELAMVALNHLVEKFNADIVISSSWRIRYNDAKMQEILDDGGFVGKVVGNTPHHGGMPRGEEIASWWGENKDNYNDYVAIDDDSDVLNGVPITKFICPSSAIGLTMENVVNFLKVYKYRNV